MIRRNIKFFIDTADANYIDRLWGLVGRYFDPLFFLGATTNPNALNKVGVDTLDCLKILIYDLSRVISEIRGDNHGVIYVQIPNSRMSNMEIGRWIDFLANIEQSNCKIGLKIPPYFNVLQIVERFSRYIDFNVTGIADASTALKCLSYKVKYVSIIPGRMEEKGINAKSQIAFVQSRELENRFGEIITGSMRTLEGLQWVYDYGTVPTIGEKVWDLILGKEALDNDEFLSPRQPFVDSVDIEKLDFSPLITDQMTQLSIDFFNQMDKLGEPLYRDFLAQK